jgi:hypothetical protein
MSYSQAIGHSETESNHPIHMSFGSSVFDLVPEMEIYRDITGSLVLFSNQHEQIRYPEEENPLKIARHMISIPKTMLTLV